VKVEAVFFAQLREVVGVRQKLITLSEGSRLADLIDALSAEHGVAFRQEVEKTEGLRLMVGNREYGVDDGRDAVLHEGDSVIFLPPIYGG